MVINFSALLKARLRLCVCIIAVLGALATTAEARRIVRILDFDGTIVDDQSENSTWRTYWILERVDRLDSMMQKIPALERAPPLIQISYREYLRRFRLFAHNGIINSLESVRLDEDPVYRGRPREFVPGWYGVNKSITFKYYRPSSSGLPYPVRDYEHAKNRTLIMNARHDGRTYDWRGPGWKLFEAGMSSPSSVADTVIFSARWHTSSEYNQLTDAFRSDGFIRFSQGVNRRGEVTRSRFYSLGSPEARLLFEDPSNMAALKAQTIQDEATALLRGPQAVGVDGKSDGPNILIAAEDDARFIDPVVRKMEELSTSGNFRYDIKFMFLNTSGSEAQLKLSRYPYRFAVISDGRARPATDEEIDIVTRLAPPTGGEFRSESTNQICKNFVGAGQAGATR